MYHNFNRKWAVSTSLLAATAAVGLIAVAIPALIASLGGNLLFSHLFL